MEEKVINIFKKNCPFLENDFVTMKLQDMGINSITFIQIVVELEECFGFEFNDEDLDYEKFIYLSDLYEYIKEKEQ